MQKQTMQFATVTKAGVIRRVGISSIYHSPIQYDGRKTKWFDDSKLIHKKSSIDSSQLPIEK